MRILHTADWHLGKIVNSVHMTEDQAYMLEELLKIIEKEKPDAIIIAGDLYDRSIPPKEAVELLNNVLTTIISTYKIPVLAISGNHDSPDRLEFGTSLFRAQHLYLQTKLASSLEPVVLHDEHGPVYFHLIPYMEPAEARAFFGDDRIHSHHTAMEAVIRRIHETQDMTKRHIFVGHAFLAGGMESESEERLSMIGGTPYIEADLLDGFCYAALGHLHQPQRVIREEVRYSGSLLKYSFSEANHQKTVTLLELNGAGECQLSFIPLKPRRDLKVLEGYFEELLRKELDNREDYLHIILLDDGQIVDPMGKLRKRFPNILRLERKVLTSSRQLEDLKRIRRRQQMSHSELFQSFYKEMKGEDMPANRRDQLENVINKLAEKERGS